MILNSWYSTLTKILLTLCGICHTLAQKQVFMYYAHIQCITEGRSTPSCTYQIQDCCRLEIREESLATLQTRFPVIEQTVVCAVKLDKFCIWRVRCSEYKMFCQFEKKARNIINSMLLHYVHIPSKSPNFGNFFCNLKELQYIFV